MARAAGALVRAAPDGSVPALSAAEGERLVIQVKATLSVDDAQICAVPNLAWAAVAQGRKVSLLFDASAVTSVTRGRGPSKTNR